MSVGGIEFKGSIKRRLSLSLATDIVRINDFLLVVICAFLAKIIYLEPVWGSTGWDWKYVYPSLICALISVAIIYRRGGYASLHEDPSVFLAFNIAASLAISFVLLIALGYAMKFAHVFSRGWLLTWFCLSVMAVFGHRIFVSRFFSWASRTGIFRKRVALIGGQSDSLALARTILGDTTVYDLVAIFDVSTNRRDAIDELIRIGQGGSLDEVIIATRLDDGEDLAQTIRELSILPIDISLCTPDWKLGVPVRTVSRVGQMTKLNVQFKPITERGEVLKMCEDYALAGLAMILLSPLFLLIALAIKLDSPGPVFFRQRRNGFNHQEFYIWKFRTMTVLEDGSDVVQASRNDQRVTRVGAILRKTSLDELPQLINVLMGEMSLVGPRPHAISHNAYYSEILRSYANRHRVKPGLTGWAQINGYRGPTEDPELMRKRVEHDLYYIDNWSIWFDLKILIATPLVGLIHKNAV